MSQHDIKKEKTVSPQDEKPPVEIKESLESHPKRGRRYQGYDVETVMQEKKKPGGRRPWFWKVFGVSILLTAVIIGGACAYIAASNRQMSDHLAKINESNTMEALLEGHKNVTITNSYSHLAKGEDYTLTRLVRRTKSGNYYSYLKKEGTSDSDYKEVIHKKEFYHYDEKFAYFYGLIGNEYEDRCVAEIEGSVYQTGGSERIGQESENGSVVSVQTSFDVQGGDEYYDTYGFEPGEKIKQTITIDKDSGIVTSVSETCDEEEFHSYKVSFDGENKIPKFYQDIEEKTETRKCTVYDDYKGENEKKYQFDVPCGVYFLVLEPENGTVYMDKKCTREYSDYQVEAQNPDSSLTLYIKRNGE